MREYGRQPLAIGLVSALALVNVALGATLTTARAEGTALAVVPAVLLALLVLIVTDRAVLVFAAIGLCLLRPLPFADPLPLSTSFDLYASDVLVALAVGSWVGARLVDRRTRGLSALRTRVLGWPLLLFGALLFIAVLRGHALNGTSLVSVPLRFFLYAGIAFALTDLDPRKAYRWLVIVFYAGTIWQLAVGVHDLLTGTAATSAVALSSGGERVLAGSTAMFMAGALLIALLESRAGSTCGEERAPPHHGRPRRLHPDSHVPANHLCPRSPPRPAAPARLQARPRNCVVVPPPLRTVHRARCAADSTSRPAPLPDARGAGDRQSYDRHRRKVARESDQRSLRSDQGGPDHRGGLRTTVTFEIAGERVTTAADPHNQFLYLWAGGGLLLLGSFVLLLVVYLLDSRGRFKIATREDRRLIFWAVSFWFLFVVNSMTGIVLTTPPLLLVFWILMVLPMIVRPGESGDITSA